MHFTISRRMQCVQTPVIPVVGELIRQHPGCISLGQGVAWYGPPAGALEAAARFGAEPAHHRYGPAQGIAPLRELIAEKLLADNGIALREPECALVVTAGANMAFLNAVLAIADPGDEIILPLPYYFNQEMAIRMIGCIPIEVETDANHQLCLERVERAVGPRTRAIVTISPNNPTGAVYPESDLRAINRLCRERGIYHISDEAYENFVYDGARHFSPGSMADSTEHTISLFSLSKSHGFASWRIGYMVLPGHLYSAVLKVQDTNLICAPLISQQAAIGALQAGSAYCLGQRRVTEDVRRLVLDELDRLRGFCRIAPAQGAFYVWIEADLPLDSMSTAVRLIREHGVAVIPGSAFGAAAGCALRVAYGALDRVTAEAGIRRFVDGLCAVRRG